MIEPTKESILAFAEEQWYQCKRCRAHAPDVRCRKSKWRQLDREPFCVTCWNWLHVEPEGKVAFERTFQFLVTERIYYE